MRKLLVLLVLISFTLPVYALDEAAVRYYNLAVEALKAGNYQQAVRDIDRALILEPKQANYHFVKGNAALGARSYSTAELAYREAIKLKRNFLEAHEGLGMALFRQGKLQAAKITFEKAKLLGTTKAEPFLYLGMIAFKEGKIDQAENLLRDATRRDGRLLEAYLTLGEIALKKKKDGEAKEAFEKASKLDPSNHRAHRRLGEIAYRQRNWDEAIPSLRKAISIKSSNHLKFLLGRALYENEDYKAAVVPLAALRKTKGYRKKVYPLLGLTYVELGRLKEADRAFREVLRDNPKEPDALRGQAMIALKRGNPQLAEKRLKKALQVLPNDRNLRFDLGKLLYDRRRYAEASPELSQAARLGFGPKAYLYLARSYEKRNKRSDSLQAYNRLLKLRSQHLEGNWELGKIYLDSRKWKAAIAKFNVVKDRLKTAEVFAGLGKSHFELKDYDEAAENYGKATEIKPEIAENHYWKGMAEWRRGKEDRAYSAMDEAVRRDPKQWESRSALGILLYNKGQGSNAENHLRRAVQLNSQAVQARYHLGRIYMDRDQPKLAVPELKKVVADDPKHTEASQLLGDAYTMLGMKNQALDAYGQSIQLGNASEFSRAGKKIDYGKLMLEQGQPDSAIVEYKKELKKKPKSVRAWTGLGRAYAELKRTTESEKSFKRALRYAPNDANALYYYGEFLRERGRQKEARNVWGKYLQAHPNGDFAKKLRSILGR